MMIDDSLETQTGDSAIGGSRMVSGDGQVSRENGTDSAVSQPLDPAIFALLLGRIEQLSRELGRAETQRSLIEQHIARLEAQIEKLSRQQDTGN